MEEFLFDVFRLVTGLVMAVVVGLLTNKHP